MKFSIPEKIKDNINSIVSVNFVYKQPSQKNSFPVNIEHIKKCNFVDIGITNFNEVTHIQYEVKYKNNTIEILKFPHKNNAIYRTLSEAALKCLKKQFSEAFGDSDEERQRCFSCVDNLLVEADSIQDEERGTKNLVYYTIYFNKGYCELLNKSIETLLQYSDSSTYDILLITDEPTKQVLEKLPFIIKKPPLYHITETPTDGVEASQQKAYVFDFKDINQYNKILFVDCDVVFTKDVSQIFNLNIKTNTLYTAYNANLNYSFHKSIHHGFEMLSDDHVKEMVTAKQMPFNAGQYLFLNTARMEQHFKNVIWFMKNWTGEYFFEQCFMNYYFCKGYLTNNLLNEHALIVSTADKALQKTPNKLPVFIHFIAPPLDAKAKLDFIVEFEKTLNIPVETQKKDNILKTFFKKWLTK